MGSRSIRRPTDSGRLCSIRWVISKRGAPSRTRASWNRERSVAVSMSRPFHSAMRGARATICSCNTASGLTATASTVVRMPTRKSNGYSVRRIHSCQTGSMSVLGLVSRGLTAPRRRSGALKARCGGRERWCGAVSASFRTRRNPRCWAVRSTTPVSPAACSSSDVSARPHRYRSGATTSQTLAPFHRSVPTAV